MKKIFTILLILSLIIHFGYAQKINGIVAFANIVDNDTIPVMELSEVRILSPIVFKNKKQERKFRKLVFQIKKVYPYAKIVEKNIKECNALLVNASTEKEKKIILKNKEKEIKNEYKDDILKLRYTEGMILLKLIDRQTKNTSYELIEDYRGEIRAVFWQTIARIFKANLKSEYDPIHNKKDKNIENIVIMIENGTI
jgi:hypothetical protein